MAHRASFLADFLPNLGVVVTCTGTKGGLDEGVAHDKVYPAMKVGSPMSDERLDRSQESFDLKKAVLAGFIKSRFWITAKRIEPHAVVGRIILLGTLLYFGLSLGMLYLHHRLPETEYFIATLGLLGLLGSWYVLQQNLGRLRRVWENKIAYGLVASLIGVCCKVLTDQQIRELTQSDPSLFPSAQAAITVLNIVEVTLSLIGGVIVLSAMLQLCKENFIAYGRKFLSIFSLTEMLGISSRPCTFRAAESFFAKIWGGFFFLFIVPFLTIGEVGGKPVNLTELFLVGSSFISNDPGHAGSGRVCINLPSRTLVSPLNTKDPNPSRVIVAQPLSTDADRLGRSYIYHVVPCSKPSDPGVLWGTDHSN
jgi:hypothetical protein